VGDVSFPHGVWLCPALPARARQDCLANTQGESRARVLAVLTGGGLGSLRLWRSAGSGRASSAAMDRALCPRIGAGEGSSALDRRLRRFVVAESYHRLPTPPS